MPNGEHPVLFFDGDCGLCHRCVRLLLRLDRRAVLRFGSLQGPAGQAFLRSEGLPVGDFDSLCFVPAGPRARPLFRTDGVIASLRACGGIGRLCGALLALVPRPVRDGGYRQVARIRYRIFGRWKPSPLPRPEWASRFIDGTA